MLKNIPNCLSPELLKILMEMGHGDEIIIGDGNFPAASNAQRLVRLDGMNVCKVLEGILEFFPLDNFVAKPVALMAVVKGHDHKPVIWNDYLEIIKKQEPGFTDFEFIERFEFYQRAQKAYAIIATSDTALYANIILKKGVVV